jgi:hydroxyethylthiazole kinase-like uncharacterized protein yjeF
MKLKINYIRSLIKKRERLSHKGDYGHVLVIAGSKNMTGAAVLAVNSALRSGAGLVTLGIKEQLFPVVAKKLEPEAMLFCYKNKNQLFEFIRKRKVTSIVLGPGLGNNKKTAEHVKNILFKVNLPVVLDADGLNVSKEKDLKKAESKLIITPHPGEFSRLTQKKAPKLQGARLDVAKLFAKQNNLICVLKGHNTVISDGVQVYENTTGNPGMAKGGSGDCLSGIIGALILQVKAPVLLSAALAGVYVHGLAGDIAAKENTEISMKASDLIKNIPKAFKRIING